MKDEPPVEEKGQMSTGEKTYLSGIEEGQVLYGVMLKPQEGIE